jgi:(1->4)-alpha-D-glucan 1-alpha-D-glucosylmutase
MTPRIPGCCYRLQFNKSFNFRDATALIDYLDALGVTDVYASPFLVARPGSAHGYDVIDHAHLNPEIGTDGDLTALAAALAQRGMGLIMDVVPNHMCIATTDNHWWNDVLENGRSSHYAAFFDIDWHPPKTELHEKVLLPVLGEQYGRVLENQEISIGYEAGAFHASYWESRYPIGPRTILPLLEPMVDDLRHSHPPDHPDVLEMESIVTATKHLPTRWDTEPDQVRERMREKEIVKRRLDTLVSGSAAVRDALERSLAAINGDKGSSRSFDRLEALLADQAYRLSFWGVAAEEINYRRFFDINDLAAIRVELPNVLDAVHDKAFQLLHAGTVTGLRIDHVDGLMDPPAYLQRLQRACAAAANGSAPPPDTGAVGSDALTTYVIVEKILSGDETLPRDWPIHGTTGYEFLNAVNGLFVDAGGARAIERLYQRLREGRGEFDDLFYFSKRLILRTAMSSELYVLARRLDRISEQHRWSRDFTQNSLHLALSEVIACFPVYRTYTQATSTDVTAGDRAHILRAIRDAKRRNRSTSESVFDFIADLLLLRDPGGLSDADRAERREFVLRLQQLTGPVMAKGLEDTVFYRYYPLASLDEVGGRPTGGGVEPARLHAWNARRLAEWPHGLSTTATHDTKRGEDVRARLNVLSEIPREWQQVLRHWQRLNRRLKSIVDDVRIPSTNEEYLIYQTLIGAWPMDAIDADPSEAAREALRTRVQQYMTKALREAKLHTSWINVNAPYEQGVAQFIDLLLQPSSGQSFVTELRRFVAGIQVPGICNSLAQVALKVTAPGVPDIYQGNELWDLSLVDPDNRRPVDFAARRALLAELAATSDADLPALCASGLRRPADGRIKMLVTTRALQHRRRHRALFDRGGYLALTAEGAQERRVFAFARTLDGTTSLTVVGRLLASVAPSGVAPVGEASWTDTRIILPPSLPAGPYRDALTGSIVELERASDGGSGVRSSPHRLMLARVFAHLPVAILEPV